MQSTWGADAEVPAADAYIDRTFGPGGYLATAFGARYEPRAGQIALARSVDTAIRDRSHLLSEAPTGCHAEGQPILMHDGSIKRVEDVAVGDQLMGPDSEPRTVLALARGTEMMVNVVPVKGNVWRVNAGHILTVVRTGIAHPDQRKDALGGQVLDVPISDWMGWSKTQKHIHKLFRTGVNFPVIDDPPLDPYILGLFLGDGALATDRTTPSITKPDREIQPDLARVAAQHALQLRIDDRDGCLRFVLTQGPGVGRSPNQVTRKLKALGLLPIRSEDRFVPDVYKRGSRQVRLEILAGLLDTDGSLVNNGYEFTSKSQRLVEGVTFLARSLGFAAYSKERQVTGFGITGTYYRTFISGDVSVLPCRIARKRASPRQQIKDVLRTGFSIELTGTVEPYFGFTLDRDGRFLLGDFTVTHNTGKSIAYSVPVSYHAATRGVLAVIVTANIALQEQIVQKDLPMLAETLPWGFSFGLLKGRANYLCRSQYEKTRLANRQQSMFAGNAAMIDSLPREDRDRLRLMQWAESAIATCADGDQSTLAWKPPDKLWRDFSVAPDECRGARCAFADSCGAIAAQRRAREAQVIVTNYHIFFTNLLIYLERGEDVILPPFDVAVFDEAHAAATIARDFFGWEISEASVRRVARHYRTSDPKFAESLERAAGWFFEQMFQLRRDRDRYKARIVPERLNAADTAATKGLLDVLTTYASRLTTDLAGLAEIGGKQATEQVATTELVLGRVRKLAGSVESVIGEPADNEVLFIEEDDFKRVHVACRLVRPAQVLRSALFGKTVPPPVGQWGDRQPVSIVCTSATLATDSSFEFTRGELGVTRSEELVVDSPFDYASQALLILPEICEPNAPEFTREVAALLLRTIELARGRTLGLFTSRKRMNDVYDAIFGRTPFRIMRQDDGQRSALIEEFKRDTHSVLLGVASFWAGVDVPGQALSCVFIDKIPFPTPDDPVLERLMETDKRAWAGYAIPRAIIEFKQGFGRLIRSATDRGVVVCCDSRILTKGYGKQFLRAMPKSMQKIRNLEAIRDWLDGPIEALDEVDPLS